MAQRLFPYAVSRVGAMENKMLTGQKLEEMASQRSVSEAFSYLRDAGYEGARADGDFEAVLQDERKKLYREIADLAPGEDAFLLFLYPYDYHNIKVLLKQEFSGRDMGQLLEETGSIPTDELAKMLKNRNFSKMPPVMAGAVAEAISVYNKTKDVRRFSNILDKACYRQMAQAAKDSENPFVVRLCQIKADTANLRTMLRLTAQGAEFHEFLACKFAGGSLSDGAFLAAFEGAGDAAKAFGETEYGEMVALGISGGFTAFEKAADDFLISFLKTARLHPLTIEPLVAYVCAKEMEIKNARIILCALQNYQDFAQIKERLRESYV